MTGAVLVIGSDPAFEAVDRILRDLSPDTRIPRWHVRTAAGVERAIECGSLAGAVVDATLPLGLAEAAQERLHSARVPTWLLALPDDPGALAGLRGWLLTRLVVEVMP